MKKVLVVCAHPGDAVIGCGGTLAHHIRNDDQVRLIVFGDGWTSRVKTFEKGLKVVDLDVLESQERRALEVLSVKNVEYCRLPDNRLDDFPLLDLVKIIEKTKSEYLPDIVYTNSPFDLSVDQQKTCRAVITAFRPQPGDNYTDLYAFESLSSTEWNQVDPSRGFKPNFFVDIDKTLHLKLKAFGFMKSEVRIWPHPRSNETIEHLARWRGSSVGVEAAEGFILLRALKFF